MDNNSFKNLSQDDGDLKGAHEVHAIEGTSAELFARYQAGEEFAAEALFQRYLARLCALARSRLSANLARRVDPDDIVMSAYRSFFVAARDGHFTVM